jgi:hypothetical protein
VNPNVKGNKFILEVIKAIKADLLQRIITCHKLEITSALGPQFRKLWFLIAEAANDVCEKIQINVE